jgi:hypothetical protein
VRLSTRMDRDWPAPTRPRSRPNPASEWGRIPRAAQWCDVGRRLQEGDERRHCGCRRRRIPKL